MISIPVFEISQPVGAFYMGVMRADHLLSISKFDYRRMMYESGYIDFLGIQRELNPKRIKDIKKYVGTVDACFPTSIVISIDEKCARVEDTDIVGCSMSQLGNTVTIWEDMIVEIIFDTLLSLTAKEKGFKSLGKARAISYFETMPTNFLPYRRGVATRICLNLHRPISMAASEMVALGGSVTGSGVIQFSTNIDAGAFV